MKKKMTVAQAGSLGGKARAAKYTEEQLREQNRAGWMAAQAARLKKKKEKEHDVREA